MRGGTSVHHHPAMRWQPQGSNLGQPEPTCSHMLFTSSSLLQLWPHTALFSTSRPALSHRVGTLTYCLIQLEIPRKAQGQDWRKHLWNELMKPESGVHRLPGDRPMLDSNSPKRSLSPLPPGDRRGGSLS